MHFLFHAIFNDQTNLIGQNLFINIVIICILAFKMRSKHLCSQLALILSIITILPENVSCLPQKGAETNSEAEAAKLQSTSDSSTDGTQLCEFSLQKVPGMKVVNIDRQGRKCEGEVLVPFCRGLCKTTESGTHTFPFREQQAHFCGLVEEAGTRNVTLEHCEEGAEEGTQFVEILAATECKCREMPFGQIATLL